MDRRDLFASLRAGATLVAGAAAASALATMVRPAEAAGGGGVTYQARLVGAAAVAPQLQGAASYQSRGLAASRLLNVSVQRALLPSGAALKSLEVDVDGLSCGHITLDKNASGTLSLKGTAVPLVVRGMSLELRTADAARTMVASGTFL